MVAVVAIAMAENGSATGEHENPNSDYTLKLTRDHIIMAKAYANIAKSKNETYLYKSLINHLRENWPIVGEANTNSELHSM